MSSRDSTLYLEWQTTIKMSFLFPFSSSIALDNCWTSLRKALSESGEYDMVFDVLEDMMVLVQEGKVEIVELSIDYESEVRWLPWRSKEVGI